MFLVQPLLEARMSKVGSAASSVFGSDIDRFADAIEDELRTTALPLGLLGQLPLELLGILAVEVPLSGCIGENSLSCEAPTPMWDTAVIV